MNLVANIFNEVFYRPLLNGLVLLTAYLPYHDLGFAIIILTVLVKFILFPFTHHSVKAQAKMRNLEPEISRIKTEHKDSQEEQSKRILALYKEHGVNPFSGCLTLLVQLPILIGLYQVFAHGIGGDVAQWLYPGIVAPPELNTMFLGLVNLSEKSLVIAALAAVTQFLQMKWATPPTPPAVNSDKAAEEGPDFAKVMNMQMTYVMPIVILFIGYRFPSAFALYWTTMNLFGIIHEAIVRRKAQAIQKAS